jgi:uroporphyrin-III C-methyltransferase
MTNNLSEKQLEKSLPWKKIGILISGSAVMILIITLYLGFYRLISVNMSLSQQIQTLAVQVNQRDFADLEKNINELQLSLKQAQDNISNQQQMISEMRNAESGKKDRWLINEAQYLTNLANDNLQVGDNIELVITLLQAADQDLSQVPDPNLTTIRKALADDIAALQAVEKVDLTSIYLQISALSGQVEKLPVISLKAANPDENDKQKSDQEVWWKRGLHQSWQVIKPLIVIRHNVSGAAPFVTPDQQAFLYQNLHAIFEQAKSAVVHKQPAIYLASLQQASAWIKQYFIQQSAVTNAVLNNISQLQAIDIKPKLPTITASQQAFRNYNQAQQS